jgi:transcriptional regulator with XRE-family HTH domain
MEPETERLLDVLKAAAKVLGFSLRELERKLGYSTGYLSRLLRGKVEVRMDHVCSIARAMGLEPSEVFQVAFPRTATPPSEAAARVRGALYKFSPPDPMENRSNAEMEQLLEKTLRRLFRELGRESDRDSAA